MLPHKPPTGINVTLTCIVTIIVLLALPLLLMMATLCLALAPNDTALTRARPTSAWTSPHSPLLETEIIRALARVRYDVKAYIRVQGNNPIMRHEYILGHRKIQMIFTPARH